MRPNLFPELTALLVFAAVGVVTLLSGAVMLVMLALRKAGVLL